MILVILSGQLTGVQCWREKEGDSLGWHHRSVSAASARPVMQSRRDYLSVFTLGRKKNCGRRVNQSNVLQMQRDFSWMQRRIILLHLITSSEMLLQVTVSRASLMMFWLLVHIQSHCFVPFVFSSGSTFLCFFFFLSPHTENRWREWGELASSSHWDTGQHPRGWGWIAFIWCTDRWRCDQWKWR